MVTLEPKTAQSTSTRVITLLPWLVLIVTLGVSLWLSQLAQRSVQATLKREIEYRAEEAAQIIRQRLASYEQVLLGGAGLFAVSREVNRNALRTYIAQLNLAQHFPGVQGLGFARWEPVDASNDKALAGGVGSGAVRRAAMELARDTGKLSLSAKVALVQENQTPEQAGFLMYLPVYRSGAPQATVVQRRQALLGWMYASIRMNDLMAGILGNWFENQGAFLHLRIDDGAEPDAQSLLFNSASTAPDGGLHSLRTVDFGGHLWSLRIDSTPNFDAHDYNAVPRVLLSGGVVISCLLAWITWLMGRARSQALQLAKSLGQKFNESERRFRGISDAAPALIWISDTGSPEVWLNARWRAFIGAPTRARGTTQRRGQIHPDDALRYQMAVSACEHKHTSYTLEYRLRHQGGRYHWLLETGIPRFADDGNYLGSVACAVDISEQREKSDALARKSDEFEGIFLAVPDGMLLVDDIGVILKANPQALKLLGYEAAQLIGRSVDTLLPTQLRPGHHARVSHYMQAPQTRNMAAGMPLRAQRLDGSEFAVDISLSPVQIDGRLCVIASLRDISESVAIKESLRRALEDAEAASRAKSEFVSNMSHEIRTPLNGVMGLTDLILTTALTGQQRQYVDMLKSSSVNLLAMVNDILDFSKIEAGYLQLESADFDLRNMLDQVVNTMRHQSQDTHLNLTCDVASDVPSHVIGDVARLRQVLWNLLGNAFKFTPAGAVCLSVCCEPEAPSRKSICLHFCVSDNGIGVAPDKLESIFQQFVQADNTISRKYGGTGLGLSISRQLVELMGGRIWVESTLGVGSHFHFTARFARAAERPPSEPVQARAGVGVGMGMGMGGPTLEVASTAATKMLKILVAEDNATNRLLAATPLRTRGHQVVEVTNGLQALEVATRLDFDLILMDMQMPAMDGLEATRALRSWEKDRGRHTRILALTANAMALDREACLAAGMDGYLSKPIFAQTLIHAAEQEQAQSQLIAPEPERGDGLQLSRLLEQAGGSMELAQSLLEACQVDWPERSAELAQALAGQDMDQVARAAHVLKGLAVLFTQESPYGLLEKLEAVAKAQDQSTVQALREPVEVALHQFALALVQLQREVLVMPPEKVTS